MLQRPPRLMGSNVLLNKSVEGVMPGIRFRRHGQQGHVLGAESVQELFEMGQRQGLDMALGMGAAFIDCQKPEKSLLRRTQPVLLPVLVVLLAALWSVGGFWAQVTDDGCCPSRRKRQKPGSPGSLRWQQSIQPWRPARPASGITPGRVS